MVTDEWWRRRWVLALLVLASAIPLLWPETPPLVDLPGHMSRYRVQLDLARSPDLQRYFEFHWALVGNLGIDLLIVPLAPMLGLELAVKLIALSIPPLTVLGLLWIAREVHGRIPPTVIFAIPFVYAFPFNFGFLNFALSLALALLAFGLWLRLTRQGRFPLRKRVFLLLSCAIWLVHVFGWGILGLLAFSSELVRNRDYRHGWRQSFFRAGTAMAPFVVPLALMVVWRSGVVSGDTARFFDIPEKFYALVAVLRDRWLVWDSFGLAVPVLLLGAAMVDDQLGMKRTLAIPALILSVAFIVMPVRIFGSAYADMRLVPSIFMIGLIAIHVRPGHESVERALAWLGLLFVVLRLAGNAWSFYLADRDSQRWLTALDHIPQGAPVLSLVGEFCFDRWKMPRHTHAGSFVIIRKQGFSNDQWQVEGAQLLRIRYPAAANFHDDRSTLVYSRKCLEKTKAAHGDHPIVARTPAEALEQFPRAAFDYVWMVEPADFDMQARPGLTPIWRTYDAVLYRVEHHP